MSRLETLRATVATHSLESPRTGVVSKLETQRGGIATHRLESRGQASSARLKHSRARQPLTTWRTEHQNGQVGRSEQRE